MKKGYDISHWAGEINWMQVAYNRPDFLIFKASDGNWEMYRYRENFDSKLIPNWERSIKYVKSASVFDTYHWLANGKDANWQADLVQFVNLTLDPTPHMTWLDAEEKTPGGSWPKFKTVWDVCDGTYTSPGWLDWASRTWGKCPFNLADKPLYLAQYPTTLDLNKPPLAPRPWNYWTIWQCNKNYKVPGIPGGVSLDVME